MDPQSVNGATRPQSELAEIFDRFLADANATGRDLPLRAWLDLAEAWRIERALRETRGNRSEAARRLGIGRRTHYAKMHKLGI
jgi:DNA-binding NtrC family response regulator